MADANVSRQDVARVLDSWLSGTHSLEFIQDLTDAIMRSAVTSEAARDPAESVRRRGLSMDEALTEAYILGYTNEPPRSSTHGNQT